MERFFTQKLSWNNLNSFPPPTFNCVSLDGSQVLCHMTPAETYTADAHFGDVKRSVTQHKSMDQDKTSLLVFGKGDGGGGATFEHLEKPRRCRGLSDKVGLLPRVKMNTSVDEFFDQLQAKAANGTDFVTWYGELYFELHRGTYTTQANNKRNNRKAEFLLREIEYLATLATVSGKNNKYKYPTKDLDDMWESVLLCQFHDCLPGSSIEICYDDTDEIYANVFSTGSKLKKEVLQALGFGGKGTNKNDLVAINTLPWSRSEIVRVSDVLPNSNTPRYALVSGNTGVINAQLLSAATEKPTVSVQKVREGVFRLSNNKLRLDVQNGVIISLYDVEADREVIARDGKAGQLVIFDDKPLYWQAWDVEVFHLDSRQVLQSSETELA
jgi:alpha-mannosidase